MLSGQVSENHAQKGSIPVFFIMGIREEKILNMLKQLSAAAAENMGDMKSI